MRLFLSSCARAAALGLLLVPALVSAAPPDVPARAVSTASVSASASVSARPDTTPAARSLYMLGADHIEHKRWKEAYDTLSEAWSLKRHWQVAMMLGWAEMEIGKVRAAIEHLAFATADKAPKEKTYTELLRTLRLQADSMLVHLRIVGVPAGARVLVDGELVGTAPLPDSLTVDPGTHTVVAELGTRKASQSVTVPASASGQSKEPSVATLVWLPASTASMVAEVPPPKGATTLEQSTPMPAPAGEKKPSLAPAIVLGAAGVAALGAGFMTFGFSEAKGAEAHRARATYDQLPADRKDAAAKKVVGDLLREQDSLITGAVAAWIGAAVLGAGAICYSVYRSGAGRKSTERESVSKTTIQWAPAVTPQGGGVIVQGSF